MRARLGPSQPAQGADVIARAMGALALIALAVIHVVDLPATLGPIPLVGIGYFGIIVAALGVSVALIAGSRWPSSPVARAIDGSAQVIITAIDRVLHREANGGVDPLRGSRTPEIMDGSKNPLGPPRLPFATTGPQPPKSPPPKSPPPKSPPPKSPPP
jgi:hypothetical protein